MNMTDESALRTKKVQVEAEIAIAEAAKKGLELDQDVVAGLISHNVRFDRKFLTFLEQYAKAGDVEDYLKNLLAKKGELTAEDEEKVIKINNAVKRAIKALDDFQDQTDLYGHVKATMLKNLLDKVTALLAAIPVQGK